MKAPFPTAFLLILVLLVQSVSAMAAALPCASEEMEVAASAGMQDAMVHPAHHTDHHPDAHPAQMNTDDQPDCCEQMKAGVCAAGGCATGTGSALTMPFLALYPPTGHADGLRPIESAGQYPSPSSAIYRPPIS